MKNYIWVLFSCYTQQYISELAHISLCELIGILLCLAGKQNSYIILTHNRMHSLKIINEVRVSILHCAPAMAAKGFITVPRMTLVFWNGLQVLDWWILNWSYHVRRLSRSALHIITFTIISITTIRLLIYISFKTDIRATQVKEVTAPFLTFQKVTVGKEQHVIIKFRIILFSLFT
jgi:hypothetical protein